jgi:hypothetical protein
MGKNPFADFTPTPPPPTPAAPAPTFHAGITAQQNLSQTIPPASTPQPLNAPAPGAYSALAVDNVLIQGCSAGLSTDTLNSYYTKSANLTTIPRLSPFVIVNNYKLTFQTKLKTVKRVRISFSPFTNPFPAFVFGPNPNPLLGDPLNIHHWPGLQWFFQGASAATTIPQYSISTQTEEIDLPENFLFYSIWIYDEQTAKANNADQIPPNFPGAFTFGYAGFGATGSLLGNLTFYGS